MEVKGQQRSNVSMLHGTKLCQVTDDDDTIIGVKGHKRSNVVNYVLWLPHLVRSTAHTS